MAIMRFAANPPALLWRVCSIWTMFFTSSFFASINALFLCRILSCSCINKFFMFLRMRVIRWMSSTNNSPKRRCEMYSLLPLVFVQTKRVASLSCKCHPVLRNSAFWPVLIGQDMMKSRWFSKSKIVCAGRSGNVPRLCAIWTPQCGGMKGKLCFIKRKSKNLVSNDRRFVRKMFRFLWIGRERIKTCGLSYETPLLFSSSSLLFGERRPFLRPPYHPLFPHPHLRTRKRTRPCASRTQRVRNSCLHPSPSPAIHWYSVCWAWRKCPFSAFTGEGNKGEAFTRKSLFYSFLHSYGEAVKAKNEKQRTRALRVRVGGWKVFR